MLFVNHKYILTLRKTSAEDIDTLNILKAEVARLKHIPHFSMALQKY